MDAEDHPFDFACPRCHSALVQSAPDELCCTLEGSVYPRQEGIWRFLDADGQARYRRFIREYETVRQAEGRGIPKQEYYRALPFEDLSGRFVQDWRVRSASFRAFVMGILQPLTVDSNPLKILDLGAGNGWLSNRLAGSGHHLAAIDLSTNELDGLGAHMQYENRFIPLQADFNHLPFPGEHVDLVIFNASLHYATSFEEALRESLRVLKPGGQVVILDTPLYRQAYSGEQMVREREALFQRQYGFPSNAIPSENFLTNERLESLAESLGLRWEFFYPHYNLRWRSRRWIARMRNGREVARFVVIAGRRRIINSSVNIPLQPRALSPEQPC
jgi:SAM-dependent methyltransferase